MNMKKIIAALAAIVGLSAAAAVEWNTNFQESLAYAEANNIPIVVVWGNTSCSHCNKLHEALDESAELEEWQSEHEVILVMKHEKNGSKKADYLAAKEWIKTLNPEISYFPFVGVYWKDARGVRCSKAFTGRNGTMPETKGTLAEQFVNSLDQLVGEYPPAPTGEATFVTADTETDRLEAVEDTQVVNVPVKRESADKELKCALKVKYPDTPARDIAVTWPIGVSNMLVAVELDPSAFDEGEKIALTLVDASGATMAKSSIAMVEEPENGMTNPAWLGESFGVGEWTMDIDAAKAKTAAASGDAYTFVMFTGALWCPWCQGLESGVLGTADFKRWAKKNKVNLVELDNPRRPVDPEKGPTGNPPTLLRYPAGNNSYIGKSVSGASYLSRKSIATEDAEAVLLRNHRLGYDGPGEGGYCAPEAARSGYPTIVLLRKDGSVAGRFNAYGPTTTSYDTDENMQRFEDFLYLVDEGDYFANWRTTTTRTLGLDEIQTAPFQINDTTEWFKLEGPFDEYITVACATERDVTLTITDADGKTIGQPAKNMLTISRPTNDVLYLKAECYENASKTEYASSSTRFTAAFTLTTSEEEPEQSVPFKSLSKAEQKHLNPELYQKQSATVPVYEIINLGGKRLVGTLAVSVSAANKITAKFTGEKTVSFSGTWDEISLSSGKVSTELAKKVSKRTYTLDLAMDAKGGFEAAVFEDGERLGSGASVAGDVSAYAGSYTVTLVDSDGEAGTGNLTVKITAAGKATVKGIMPDGTSISVSAVISPNVDGTATLPIYKASSKYAVSVALAIKPDADETWESEGDKYTVRSVTGCLATYNTISFSIFGGYWESTTPLAICEQYNLSEMLDVVIGGETNDIVMATKTGFKVTKAVLQSLSFTKSTGAFSGKAKVYVEELGRSVAATVKGVLLPGWIDCKCGGEPVVERPYGSGTVYYKSGRTTVSLPIDLVAESAE